MGVETWNRSLKKEGSNKKISAQLKKNGSKLGNWEP